MENENKIAVLIDAENVSYKNAKRIIDILEAKGKILVREIVADWTKINATNKDKSISKKIKENLSGWREMAALNSMTAIQQFTYVSGKNSSDIAMAIRAMKTLYEKPYINVFCLIANDSDFTRLAQELRENNKYVIGMGEKEKAIDEFVRAFSEYIYLDELINDESNETAQSADNVKKPSEKKGKAKTASKTKQSTSIVTDDRLNSLIEVIQELIDEKGRALYSAVNKAMKNKYPDFVPQNLGYQNFRQLMDALMPKLNKFEKIKTSDDYALIEKGSQQ